MEREIDYKIYKNYGQAMVVFFPMNVDIIKETLKRGGKYCCSIYSRETAERNFKLTALSNRDTCVYIMLDKYDYLEKFFKLIEFTEQKIDWFYNVKMFCEFYEVDYLNTNSEYWKSLFSLLGSCKI